MNIAQMIRIMSKLQIHSNHIYDFKNFAQKKTSRFFFTTLGELKINFNKLLLGEKIILITS